MRKYISESVAHNLGSNLPNSSIQRKKNGHYLEDNRPNVINKKKINKAGLPDTLKNGIENLSGIDMSDTKVHYNSSKPTQLKAHAYAQGSNIHLGPGQEKHLPHEAWHVVQQKQGRVKPTLQLKGTGHINDNPSLEHEADVMGHKAEALPLKKHTRTLDKKNVTGQNAIKQFVNPEVRVTGLTHLVIMLGKSIMKGKPGPTLRHGTKLTINPNIKFRSRRGPNQEMGHGDEDNEHIYRWFKVLKLNGKVVTKNYFIRDGTFITDSPELFGTRPEKIGENHRVRGQATYRPFKVNVRRAEWGEIVEIAPGIGVEVRVGENEHYVHFIQNQIHKILGTGVGTALLSTFNPKRLGQPYRMVKDQSGPLKGITVLIGQPQQKVGSQYRQIQTGDIGGIKPDGKKAWTDPKIPRISFFDKPAKGKPEEIGTSKSYVTEIGVEKHKDFPEHVQPFDVVLFHEFVHAYISQIGVFKRLTSLGDGVSNKLPPFHKDNAHVEEQLVVGLAGGAGRYFSENRYRMAKRLQKRGTYHAVDLKEGSEKGSIEDWLHGISIEAALVKIGLSEAQAKYVAGGH